MARRSQVDSGVVASSCKRIVERRKHTRSHHSERDPQPAPYPVFCDGVQVGVIWLTRTNLIDFRSGLDGQLRYLRGTTQQSTVDAVGDGHGVKRDDGDVREFNETVRAEWRALRAERMEGESA